MPPADDDDRYRRVLEEFGSFARETQEYRARTERSLAEMQGLLNAYWAATAAALRQLSNWFAETEDAAREERRYERMKRGRFEAIIIALLCVLILLVGGLLWVFR